MNAVVGCTAPEKWWADQRAKRRTVVLVIVLVFYGWLTTAHDLTAPEAASVVMLVGIAAGVVLDRVVDGNGLSTTDVSLLQHLAGPGRL